MAIGPGSQVTDPAFFSIFSRDTNDLEPGKRNNTTCMLMPHNSLAMIQKYCVSKYTVDLLIQETLLKHRHHIFSNTPLYW